MKSSVLGRQYKTSVFRFSFYVTLFILLTCVVQFPVQRRIDKKSTVYQFPILLILLPTVRISFIWMTGPVIKLEALSWSLRIPDERLHITVSIMIVSFAAKYGFLHNTLKAVSVLLPWMKVTDFLENVISTHQSLITRKLLFMGRAAYCMFISLPACISAALSLLEQAR